MYLPGRHLCRCHTWVWQSPRKQITMDSIGDSEEENILICSTDREDCCTDEFSIPGSWFLPNGSKIHVLSSRNNTQSLHITLGNQTIGLNITNNPEMPAGIYHCEVMDRENVTHHLYAGIYPENEGMTSYSCAMYNSCVTVTLWLLCNILIIGNITNISVEYNRTSQTVTCTSTGGPAKNVIWYKDDIEINMISSERGIYENSQIILMLHMRTGWGLLTSHQKWPGFTHVKSKIPGEAWMRVYTYKVNHKW